MPKKKYEYEIYEDDNGEKKIRRVSGEREIDMDSIIFESTKGPKEMKERQDLYNKGLIGLGHAEDYAQTIEWGREGGLLGGRPKVYDIEKDKYRAYRIRKKLKVGMPLKQSEIEWLKEKGINLPDELR